MEKLYHLFTEKSVKTRHGNDCGSDHELLIVKFSLKLKKAGKTTRPFRYDLNQIPCDCTVEVSNRFKGLDLVNRVQEVHRSITMNKASGDDGIPAELVQILKDDAIKMLHSIHQQIWKTQQWHGRESTILSVMSDSL